MADQKAYEPSEAEVQKILYTIREAESGNDYTKPAKGSTASGAYQFINDTWKRFTRKYGIGTEHKTAKEAPPEVQDAVAAQAVRDILRQTGGDVTKVPIIWYTGNPQGNITQEALRINRGLTPSKYQQKWMSIFNKAPETPSEIPPPDVNISIAKNEPTPDTTQVTAPAATKPAPTPAVAPKATMTSMDLLPASYKTALAMNYLADTDPEAEVMTKAMELMDASGIGGDGGGVTGGKVLQQYAQNMGKIDPFAAVMQPQEVVPPAPRPVVPRMPVMRSGGGPVGQMASANPVEVDGYATGGEAQYDPSASMEIDANEQQRVQYEAQKALYSLQANLGPASARFVPAPKGVDIRTSSQFGNLQPYVDVSPNDLAVSNVGVTYRQMGPQGGYQVGMSQRTPTQGPSGPVRYPVVVEGGFRAPIGSQGSIEAQGRYVPPQYGMPQSYSANLRYQQRFADGGEVYTDPMGNVVGPVEGAVPKEQWAGKVKEAGKEVLRSTQYYPYDLLGAPVDIVNLGLKGVDYVAGTKLGQEKPVGGSEWLIEKSKQAGIADEPTNSPTEMLTRLGVGFVNPLAPVRATVQGIKALAPVGKALELPGVVQTAPVGAISIGKPKPGINYDLLRPTENSPFVGELERIVADLPGPVKLPEFEKYLAKNARNYERNRFTELMADVTNEKGTADIKLTPQEILDRLQRTSPQRYKTDIIEPGTRALYQRQDNPFPENPVGSVNLELKVPPELQDAQSKIDALNSTIGEFSSYHVLGEYNLNRSAIKKAADDVRYSLDQFADTHPELVKKGQDILDEAQNVLVDFSNMYTARDEVVYPMISKRVQGWADNPKTVPMELRDKDGRLDYNKAVRYVMQDGLNNFREAYGRIVVNTGGMDPKADFSAAYNKLKAFVDASTDRPYFEIAAGPELNNLRESAQEFTLNFIHEMAPTRRLALNQLVKVRDELNDAAKLDIYEGGHPSITKNNPISFSRFVDFNKTQASEIGIPLKDPDRGAMMVLELQSDRLKAAKRGIAEEAFPGMAALPQVTQQLMIKNAIYGAAKRDKGLLLFPGTDSAQSQLYEKLGPNLKQVIKDLGPGLKAEHFEFPNANNEMSSRWGVYIDKDAAKRILKQGIRFAKGGMVDKPLYDRAA